ncbi:polysaccharide pyruvyl transferase family protein [Hyphomicrobium sp.]|uniref:polysaccharide pyruvyl transferase family protein n=1 Tax=Hyphomicrobium sp. TaxID=82 RepID=UPI002D791738|nr:polysaccharide pyruvyl transferase family protein [Hyphomicrobium sp.]HET6388992.1 polysaccharide pyruvyl transferase family protein [Hyphomicrobium sp.]
MALHSSRGQKDGHARLTSPQRALLLGHFSTVGDLQCLDFAKRVLEQQNCAYDVAPYSERVRKAMPGAVAPWDADPARYSHLLVICGPCWPEFFQKRKFDFERFGHCNRIGLNLTMVKPLSEWNPFDTLLERDSDASARPDLTFLVDTKPVPVVGRCIIRKQGEYGERQRHEQALAAIDDLIARWKLPVIEIDTRWPNDTSLSGPDMCPAVSALISRVDVLITNRLHGLVFAIRNSVPVLAVDAVAGGDKVTAQARTIEWPICLDAETATPAAMDRALSWCLSEEAKDAASLSKQRAENLLDSMETDLSAAILRPVTRKSPRPTVKTRRTFWDMISRVSKANHAM